MKFKNMKIKMWNKKIHNLMNSKAWKYIGFSAVTMLSLAGVLAFPQPISKLTADEVRTPKKNYFTNVKIEGKAAFVYDLSTRKVLYAKNDKAVLPLASITKVMTAITALEQSATSTYVTVQNEHLAQEGDSGLLNQETWSLKSLLKYMLVVSSNDGAAAVASAVGTAGTTETDIVSGRGAFIKNMNDTARRLGLTKMWFTNESGLDQDTVVSGGYGSARDVGRLMEYAIKHHKDVFQTTNQSVVSVSSEQDIAHTGRNTNILTDKIPGLIASKTGYSELAGGNLAIVFEADNKHPVVVVVLGSSYDGRFRDVDTLVKASRSAVKEQ
jgi:serine-type D-Ala-D-Ala carboxypeptidase (penicillin-binding protein 5/6)